MRKQRHQSYRNCPVEVVLDMIAGKWKTVILFNLSGGTLRFNELQRALPSITRRMLTTQLRELEQDGLITRTAYPEVPPKVEYALSPLGISMGPLLAAMYEWGKEHVPARVAKEGS
jgi:DNA-binding HxlR family transcriptional regulator